VVNIYYDRDPAAAKRALQTELAIECRTISRNIICIDGEVFMLLFINNVMFTDKTIITRASAYTIAAYNYNLVHIHNVQSYNILYIILLIWVKKNN